MDRDTLPEWAINIIRRLRCLTRGRYFAIIDLKRDGEVDTITILSSGKIERVNPDCDLTGKSTTR